MRNHETRGRRILVSASETLLGVDGERHLASWGGPDLRQVVVLCHGLREHVGPYDAFAQALTATGTQVYALDQAGHGRSEGSPGLINDLEAAIDDQRLVVQLARARHPGLPLVVLGHGTGGTLAVRLAQALPSELSALVLSAPLIGAQPGTHRDDPRLSIEPPAGRELSRDPAVTGRYAADPLVWRGQLPMTTAAALHRGLQRIDHGPHLRLPVLWLHGTADRILPREATGNALRRLFSATALSEIAVDGGRHQLLLGTDAENSIANVTGFLTSALRRSAVA